MNATSKSANELKDDLKLYETFERSWKETLKQDLLSYELIEKSDILPGSSKQAALKVMRNKLKRDRWNITRAQNLTLKVKKEIHEHSHCQ